MENFWEKLVKPFFVLAPMYDVTDAAFRQMFVKYSKGKVREEGEVRNATSRSQVVFRTSLPLVLFTEFVSADGLASEEGRLKLLRELYYTEAERPIVAQIFGFRPETIEKAVRIIKDLGFNGVDINMGCPDRAVEKQGAGSALIKKPKLAQEIIVAAKKAAGNLPVSVKTRLGYNKIDFHWIKTILEAKPDALTVHLRTRKEMSEAGAHFEVIPDLVKLAREAGVILIVNGDIKSVEEGEKLAEQYQVDGLMIGRGAFGKPWLFANLAHASRGCQIERTPKPCAKEDNDTYEPDLSTRLKIMFEHSRLFEDLYLPGPTNDKLFHGHTKNFAVMRKHFKAYVTGFKGATALRARLMEARNSEEVKEIISNFLV